VHVGEAVPRALGDPARLRQVLTNLVTNAHLYTPERGTVTVRVDDGPAGVRLEVADTGVGMDADELEHVFDRFVRGRQQDAAGGATGSGLGLSIVKQLVDLHGGTVDVRSAPGRGTAFTVTLPRAPEPGARPGRTALAGRRVVVLDDEPEVARAIAGLLTPYGVSCEVVHDGATALALLREDPPDALTVDVLMPGMSGFEVLRALRQDPALAGVPAVVVSAFSGREALSGEWVVAKPVDPEELADALGAAVLSSRVRVLACVRAAERPRVAALLDDAGVGREWAASPQEAAELCRQHRFEVALLDAGLEDLDATVAALDLRGRRLPRAVVVLGDDDGHPGLARLDARPVPLAEAGAAVLRLLGAGGGIGSAQA
jgi:CheY-like chemotaxis protein/anti-sigma regulatory factor (Ser/Thr protein kinase)